MEKSKLPNEIDIYTDASVSTSHIGVAWTCPESPSLGGQLSLRHDGATALEAELHAINGALNHICYDLNTQPPSKIRILTDSFEAIKELRKPLSLNPLGNSIILHKELLKSHNVHIRIDWIPGHEETGPGNQSAHEAAQECLNFSPPLVPLSASTPTPPALLLLRLQKRKRQRYQQVTPPGYLANIVSCSRSEEVFINKLCADAAYTPHITQKWTRCPNTHPRCPYCNTNVKSDLHHLVWTCPHFAKHRPDNLTNINPDRLQHEAHTELDVSLLRTIAAFAVKSGLARVV